MNKNVGNMDRIVRLLVAVIVFALIANETIQGTLAWVLGAVSLVFAVTALVRWCPIYRVLGMSTVKDPS